MSEIISFGSLRDDWIKGADLVARLIARSKDEGTILGGFPRQWIPLFIHFDANWQNTVAEQSFVPLASDLSEFELTRLSISARGAGVLRTLVEAFAALDPLIADVLYKLDRRVTAKTAEAPSYLPLTGWQSYGRPEVLQLNKLIERTAKAKFSTAVLLPCARKRPYSKSKTHRKIWRELEAQSVQRHAVDTLVVSSIGIVPESLWEHPVVLAYDSGVPDIYRVLRLMRNYFQRARYSLVIDCLDFKPYSDCLQIIAREGGFKYLRLGQSRRVKNLPSP